MRMTRDGAVEDNLTEGTSERISKRLEDAQLVKPHEADSSILPEEAAKHKQPIPEDLLPKQEEPTTENTETVSEHTQPEYKPGEMPVIESHSPAPSVPEVHHSAPVDPGIVMVKTSMTSSRRVCSTPRRRTSPRSTCRPSSRCRRRCSATSSCGPRGPRSTPPSNAPAPTTRRTQGRRTTGGRGGAA